jgi:hypothetical protein
MDKWAMSIIKKLIVVEVGGAQHTCQKSKTIPTCDWFMKSPFCNMSVNSYCRGLMLLKVTAKITK